mgnify:CR=1 FL=1
MYEPKGSNENTMTQMTSLHEERLDFVFRTIRETGAKKVLDLGCGSGSLLYRLLADPQFERITGLEDSGVSLRQARAVLEDFLNEDPPRVKLIRGSYAERNPALTGYEAAAMVETIEHVRPEQLSKVELAVFGQYRPDCLLMTTPNREYNPLLGQAPGELRDPDHKFEWDRVKFQRWARGVADRNGYDVEFGGIGEFVPDAGHPTQTAFFTRKD